MKNRRYAIFALALLGLALIANQSLAQSIYEPYTFITLAGDSGFGSTDGMGSGAQFWNPSGVAVDSVGNVYVADQGNNTIRKVTSGGEVATLAGLAGSSGSADGTGSVARFNQPFGVAVDNAGILYVADTGNHTIRKVTPMGMVTTLAGFARTDGNGNPVGGNADGKGVAAQFNSPRGVAVAAAGNILVADTGNHTIRKITSAGVVTTLAAGFRLPSGVAIDSLGNVYVADFRSFSIRKVTPDGVVTTLAGLATTFGSADGAGNAARFGGFPDVTSIGPFGLAVDAKGNVYVTDTGNFTIRKVTSAGVVTTLAGLPGVYGSADGTGSSARFGGTSVISLGPTGVALDNLGNVYVADTSTIRKGNPALAITSSEPDFGFTDGRFGFHVSGPVGKLMVIEASTDLVIWLPISTNTLASGLKFSDSQSAVYSNRFYRTRTP